MLVASVVVVLVASSHHCAATAFVVVARPISNRATALSLQAAAAVDSSSSLGFFEPQHAQLLLSQQHQHDASQLVPSSSSMSVSAVTLDPTTALSDIFSGILGTPLILAVPIVAYASPAEEQDD
jgi:hypothetical protein